MVTDDHPNLLSTRTHAPRNVALDALRGYAILTMALSGMVPWGTLPQWMYHAQLIAPQMKYDLSVAGITWVDLVFPFFLFSMGAAIPLSLARRVDRPHGKMKILGSLTQRAALLVFFAIYVRQIAPTVIAYPTTTESLLLGLLGFLILFPTLTRLPTESSPRRKMAIRMAGWTCCIGLILWLNAQQAEPNEPWVANISKERDIIILVLANTVFTGGIIWLLTRRWIAARIAIMIAILAMRMSHDIEGWTNVVWTFTPANWLYQFSFQQYLLIIIPGTIIGDILLASSGARAPYNTSSPANNTDQPTTSMHSSRRKTDDRLYDSAKGLNFVLAALALFIIVGTVIGLQARATSFTLIFVLACQLAVLGTLRWSQRANHRHRSAQILIWGGLWLLIGLAFEPAEGGIKKDSPTISYYFVTSGLACFALAFFQSCLTTGGRARYLRWLIETGQNPMIAYVAIRSFIPPVVGLTGVDASMKDWLSAPWAGVGWAAIKVLLLAAFVSGLTRRRIFWRT